MRKSLLMAPKTARETQAGNREIGPGTVKFGLGTVKNDRSRENPLGPSCPNPPPTRAYKTEHKRLYSLRLEPARRFGRDSEPPIEPLLSSISHLKHQEDDKVSVMLLCKESRTPGQSSNQIS